jgi:hypothetical protein
MLNETASKTAAKPRGRPSRKRHADRPGESADAPKKSAGDEAKRGTSTNRKETVVTAPAYFFEPPLIQGESRADYDAIFNLIKDTIAPTNFIELMWVKDVADLFWESQRARLLRAKFINAVRSQAWGAALADGILKRAGAGGLGSERAVGPEVQAKFRDLRGLIAKMESGEATPLETSTRCCQSRWSP